MSLQYTIHTHQFIVQLGDYSQNKLFLVKCFCSFMISSASLLSVFHPFLMELWTYINPCLQTKRLIYLSVFLSSVQHILSLGHIGIYEQLWIRCIISQLQWPNHYWKVHHMEFWRISVNHFAVSLDIDTHTHTTWFVLFTSLSLSYPSQFLSMSLWTGPWQGVLYRPANEYLSACCYC